MSVRIQCVVIDAHYPGQLARFWAEALGWRITFEDQEEVVLEPPEGAPLADVVPDLLFLATPDGKQNKNRLHIDLRPDDQQAEVDRLLALGATKADIGQKGDESWVVLADPEGNEFCVLRALRDDEK